MAKIEKHIVQEGQNIYDICIQHYGSVDGLAEIMALNTGLDIDLLYAGQEILYTPTELNANVLKSLSETQYIPATSSEMLPTPVPPPSPAADAVVIHLYGIGDIEVPAPGEYTVVPSTVEDGSGGLIATLSPGEAYIDAPEEVDINYPNGSSTTVIAPGTFNVPPATVTFDGVFVTELSPDETYDFPAQVVTINYPNGTVIPQEAPAVFNVPESTVLGPTGSVLAELSPGETYTVETSGIAYTRIPAPQIVSYANGDIGWCVQNGRYNWAEVALPVYTQCLDNTVAPSDWFFRLKHNNAFGNKYRFTDATGASATDGALNFDGAITYVIDHLTGLGFYRPQLATTGSWTLMMDAIRTSSFLGFSDWMPITRNVISSCVPPSSVFVHSSLSLFTGASQSFWFGETMSNSTTTAFRSNSSQQISGSSKTIAGLAGQMFRIHYK